MPIRKERVRVLIKNRKFKFKNANNLVHFAPFCRSFSLSLSASLSLEMFNEAFWLRIEMTRASGCYCWCWLTHWSLRLVRCLSSSSTTTTTATSSSSTLKVSFKLINSPLAVCARVWDRQREKQRTSQAGKQNSLMHLRQHQTIYKRYICLQACNSLD